MEYDTKEFARYIDGTTLYIHGQSFEDEIIEKLEKDVPNL